MVSGSNPNERGEPDKGSTPLLSYTEQFYSHLPFYLSIGMTFEQYWNEDCCLVEYYRKAYELKKKRDNEMAWLQGMYIYEALCDASPVLNAFAKKGTKPHPYSTEPYAITVKDVREKNRKKERDDYERKKATMTAFAIAFNKRMSESTKKEVDVDE